MSLSQPKPPDASVLASTQTDMNKSAAETQRALSEQNKVNPFGGVNYTDNTITSWLSPEMQKLLSQFQGTQGQIGGIASQLAGNMAQTYGAAPDFTSASAPLVKSQMDAFNKYMAPTYAIQQSNLDSRLQNEGLSQGSEAWTNAQRSYQLSQDQAGQSALMQFEPQAFQQAMATYTTPLQTLAALFGATLPGASASGINMDQTPVYQANVQPANYMGAAEQQFGQKQQQFQNTMQGLGQIGGALGSGLFGGAGGLGSALKGMFGGIGGGLGGGAWGGGNDPSNPYAFT